MECSDLQNTRVKSLFQLFKTNCFSLRYSRYRFHQGKSFQSPIYVVATSCWLWSYNWLIFSTPYCFYFAF